MTSQATWKLPQNLIQKSVADNWPDAVREWELTGVEFLAPGEFRTCLCTHFPIRQLCYISNRLNHQTEIVGNVCIEKFENSESDIQTGVFSSVPKVVQAARRILQDPDNNAANEALIDFAEKQSIITKSNAIFYRDIWRKRKLTPKQLQYKRDVNLKILYQAIYSLKQAFHLLKENPEEGTAGPKLVDFAFTNKVLTKSNADFYMKIWSRRNSSLTAAQMKYKIDLNNRIITQLQPHFQSEQKENPKRSSK